MSRVDQISRGVQIVLFVSALVLIDVALVLFLIDVVAPALVGD